MANAGAAADDVTGLTPALADRPGLFGPVASDSTVWRLLAQLTDRELAAVGAARAAARGVAWAQRAEVTGAAVPPSTAAWVDGVLFNPILLVGWGVGAGDMAKAPGM
jgi:hypothetical protein